MLIFSLGSYVVCELSHGVDKLVILSVYTQCSPATLPCFVVVTTNWYC